MKELKKMDDKIDFIKNELNHLLVYENYLYGKQSKKKFPPKAKKANDLLKRIHYDIIGLLSSYLGGSKYFY
jgi:hypothetical protein